MREVGGVSARVVDGDQSLWLDVGAQRVVVLGVEGEPLLRFDRGGVWVNTRSLSAAIDGIDPAALHSSPSGRPPLWRRVAAGHSYLWRDRRLWLLEVLAAGASRGRVLGRWVVPLLVDGRPAALRGVLDYSAPPPPLLWPAVALVLAAASGLLAGRRPGSTAFVAIPCLLAVWTLRVGRELYGRPFVGAGAWVELALGSALGFALAAGLVQRDPDLRRFAGFLVGLGGVYQASTMLPVLTHSLALSLLPAAVAHALVSIALGCGLGAVAGWLRWPAPRRALVTPVPARPRSAGAP